MADGTCRAENAGATEIGQGLEKIPPPPRGARGTRPQIDGLQAAAFRHRRQAMQMATGEPDAPELQYARLAMAKKMQALEPGRAGDSPGQREGTLGRLNQRQSEARAQPLQEQLKVGQGGISDQNLGFLE
jgi:hypothetical protein